MNLLENKPRIILSVPILLFGLVSACRPPVDCQRMRACCKVAKQHPDIGQHCRALSSQTSHAETCRTVLQTIRAIYDKSDDKTPRSCRPTE